MRKERFPIALICLVVLLGGAGVMVVRAITVQAAPKREISKPEKLGLSDDEKALALARQNLRKKQIERYLAGIANPKESSKRNFVGLLRDMNLPASDGVPIFTQLLNHKDRGVLYESLYSLGGYGSEASSAIPRLIAFLKDPTTNDYLVGQVQKTIASIDPQNKAFVALLGERISDRATSGALLKETLDALAKAGPVARASLPHIEPFLAKRYSTKVQYKAYKAIGKIQNRSLPTTKALAKLITINDLLQDDNGFATFAAILKSGSLPLAKKQALLHTLCREDSRRYIQCAAVETANQVGTGGPEHIQVLLDVLAGTDEYLAEFAVEGLKKLDLAEIKNIPVLISGLGHEAPTVRFHAALSLARYGKKATPAADALVKVLEGVDRKTVDWHLGAYLDLARALGSDASKAIPAIVALLPETSNYYKGRGRTWVGYTRGYLLVTLADIDIPKEALPFIIDLFANADSSHDFTAAAIAAGALGPDAERAVPFLIERALKSFGRSPVTFESFLLAFSPTNTYTYAQLEAIRALGKIGPKAKAAVPILEDLLKQDLDETGSKAFNMPSFKQTLTEALDAIQAE